MKLGQVPGLPMTDEVAAVQKKARIAAGQETTEVAKGSDVYEPSEAAIGLDRPGAERFLEDIQHALGNMDPNSETFLPDATQKLINYALGHELGDEISRDPGYPQMKAKLAKQLLGNPDLRDQVENLLVLLTGHRVNPRPEEEDEEGSGRSGGHHEQQHGESEEAEA